MKTLLFISTILLATASCTTNRRHYGNYYNKWRYWGAMYSLKPDSTFDYTFRNNAGEVTTSSEAMSGTLTVTSSSYIFSDTSYGLYKMQGDTVYLVYLTDTIHGNFNGNNVRPTKLFWEGKKLFYITPTGEIIRQKEYYMQLRNDKIGNLYRWDEKWTAPK